MESLFAQPWGLAALAALPLVAWIHLHRRRFEPRVVSALFLWADEDRAVASGRKRDKLRSSASLVAELAAALALALGLAGPRGCGASRGEHLVVLLDGSASMQAVAGGTSARERALELVRARIADLPAGSRVSAVESGARPRTLAGPAALPEEALAALERYQPCAGDHSRAPALALARELAAGGPVLAISDAFEDTPGSLAAQDVPAQESNGGEQAADVEFAAVGAALDNWGFVRAERELAAALAASEPGSAAAAERPETIRATVASWAGEVRRLEIVLEPAGLAPRVLASFELAPDGERQVAFEIPGGVPLAALRLRAADGARLDGFVLDDVAWLAPPPRRTLLVASTLAAEELARLVPGAGAGISPLARVLRLVDDAALAPALVEAHLVIGAADGSTAPRAWTLASARIEGATTAWLGPFLTERSHPLFDGVSWGGVVWSGVPGAALPGTPLVRAGSDALLAEDLDPAGVRRAYWLNLDPARSTLTKSPDWPVLLANLCELRRAELPGPDRTSLTVGARWVYRGAEPGRLAFVGPLSPGPDGALGASGAEQRLEFQAGTIIECDAPPLPGAWRVDSPLDSAGASSAARTIALLGISALDARESDLRGRCTGSAPSQLERASTEGAGGLAEALCAAIALACLLFDWTVLKRGVG